MSVHTMSAKRFYEEALEIVHEQQPDAFLVGIKIDFRAVDDYRRINLTYYFESPSTPTRSYHVLLMDGLDPGFSTWTHPAHEYVPITEQDWLLDSPQALAIAHDAEGCQFFTKWRSESTALYLGRRHPIKDIADDPNPVEWGIIYSSIVTGARLEIRVDAITGEITHVSRTEP